MISVISEIIEPIIRLLKDRKINQLKTGKQNTGNNIKNGTEPKPTVSFYVIRLDLTFLRQFSIVIRIVIRIAIRIVGLRPVIPPSHRGHWVNTGQYRSIHFVQKSNLAVIQYALGNLVHLYTLGMTF